MIANMNLQKKVNFQFLTYGCARYARGKRKKKKTKRKWRKKKKEEKKRQSDW